MDLNGFEQRLEKQVNQGRTSEHTKDSYVGSARRFEEWLVRTYGDPDDPDADQVREYLDHLAEEGRANSGIQQTYYGIKRYFKWQGREHELNDVDSHVSDHYPVGGSGTPEFFDDGELDAMKEASKDDPRDGAMIHLLAFTGMRVGEIVGLDLEDIDLAEKVVMIERQKRNETIYDALPINSETVSQVDRYLEHRDEYGDTSSDALFITRNGRMTADTARTRVKNVAERAGGVDEDGVHPHMFRHTVGTRLAEKGRSATEIADYLGHADASTSQKYIHLSSDHREGLLEDLTASD